jgi:hypothetical protein
VRSRFRSAFEIPFSLEALDREPLLEISPVRLEGVVSRIEGGFALDARCAFEGKLECSRCLAAYPFASDEAFVLVLYKRTPGSPDVRELSRDDLDVAFYEGEEMDVTPARGGASPDVASDEASLPGRLPRALFALRRRSQSRSVRGARPTRSIRAGRLSPASRTRRNRRKSRNDHAQSENAATARPVATSAARTTP